MGRHGENIHKRKDGRWVARLLCKKENGEKYYKYFYGNSYNEAKEKRYLGTLKLKESENSKKDILFKDLIDIWLSQQNNHIKLSTHSKYVFIVEKYIKPSLGDFYLSKIDTSKIEDLKTKLLTNGKINGIDGLSAKTVNSILSIIKLTIEYGEKLGYKKNENLKITNCKQVTPEIVILKKEEQQKLEKYVLSRGTIKHICILLVLYTGLRIGELCALQWKDFDFENRTLKISKTVSRIHITGEDNLYKTELVFSEPKTENSKREIPLPELIVKILEPHKKENNIFVLSSKENCIDPRNYFNFYKSVLKKCNLPDYTFHCLRHTFATRCIEYGFDVKSLSEILGHSDVQITLNRYVHPSMDSKRTQMENIVNKLLCIDEIED